jgi:hypothetical protein
MIVQSLQQAVTEIEGLWDWVIAMMAGWGLTLTLVIAVLIYAHVRINRLNRKIDQLNNNTVAETRDLSLRLRKIEK